MCCVCDEQEGAEEVPVVRQPKVLTEPLIIAFYSFKKTLTCLLLPKLNVYLFLYVEKPVYYKVVQTGC
jgi:hypothetical protein